MKFAFLELHERSCKESADHLAQNVQRDAFGLFWWSEKGNIVLH
jgi:hypothetical protein